MLTLLFGAAHATGIDSFIRLFQKWQRLEHFAIYK
jgi:hypothetical protein